MADKILTGEQNARNTFANFTLTPNQNRGYYLPAMQNTGEDKFDLTENQQIKKSHKKRNLAFAVGTSALAVGGGVLILMRGLPKNTEKYLEKLKKYLEKKLEKASLKGSDRWSEFFESSIRFVNSAIEKAQSINNFTSLKDIGFKWLMDKTPLTAKIHQGITNFFERLARRTVISSYKSTNKKFAKMYEVFDKLDEQILKTNPDELVMYNGRKIPKWQLIDIAKKHRLRVKNAVKIFTSEKVLDSRYKYIKDATSALYEQFWDASLKGFWSKENKFRQKEIWQTFIPDEKIKGNKKIMAQGVADMRNLISYTEKDKTKIMSEYLKTLKNIIPPFDKDGLGIIKKLEWFLDNPEGIKGANKEIFIKELSSLVGRPFPKGLDAAVIQKQAELRKSYVKSITELLDDDKTGALQEMMFIYNAVAPYELAKSKADIVVKKAVSSFDKSLKTETVEFFDKVRDLRLGSAPTDVLSILASAGMIGYGLCEAEDKDERTSVMLSAGIPIIGTIGTTVICTTKLISGMVSLALGGAVGVVFKFIGDKLDKHRMNLKSKNHTND